MNKTLLSILMFAFLLLFIVSPFAALSGLMLVSVIAGFLFVLSNLLQVVIHHNTDSNAP
ncbi:hypothetical protein I8748_25545 [Nostoc sp. CENA67]|uniref:Uncharacterized protein n=1 Tax=Amazonocrinis nigriterrae CENA67 TaxID=2794033 RepID=A0A8J7HT51_9NOST|nr:hypothetical protein [Amazonocrinis nigriterrae]MBH8565498.1 hypothetical protein [Amazonocrinis nigriterrae CENA67]